MSEPIRILQVVPDISQVSGIAQVVANWYRHLDTSKVQFDYIYTAHTRKPAKEDEIVRMGGRCYYLPYYRTPLAAWRELNTLLRENRYQTLHSHVLQLPAVLFPLAKKYGVKHIIQHMHNPSMSDRKLAALRNYLLIHSVWRFITHKMACSRMSGLACFGSSDFEVVNNGIDVENFVYNPAVRAEKRKELGLENNFVIGHIGRFSPQKNHAFLIRVFERVAQANPAARLLLIGTGVLRDRIAQTVRAKGLRDRVIFTGMRTDIPQLLQAMDVFCMPSLFEGLGIVAVEAQAAGLPCVLADTLPQEAFICNYKKLPLGDDALWAREVLGFAQNFGRTDTAAQIKAAGFCAKEVARHMQDFYCRLEGKL